MAGTVNWTGSGSTSAPQSGKFETGANWTGGKVPGATSDAVLGAGSYTVTLSARGATPDAMDQRSLDSLSIGNGATLAFNVSKSSVTLTTAHDITNSGTISIGASTVYQNGNSTQSTYVTFGAQFDFDQPPQAVTASFVNTGTLSLADGAGGSLSGAYLLVNQMIFSNKGTVEIGVDAELDAFEFGNARYGLLSGGTWIIHSQGIVGTFESIYEVAKGTSITLDGAGSDFLTYDFNTPNPTPLEDQLNRIDAGATLTLSGGHVYAIGSDVGQLAVAGTLALANGTVSGASGHALSLLAGGTLTGTGTLAVDATLAGTVTATAGNLSLGDADTAGGAAHVVQLSGTLNGDGYAFVDGELDLLKGAKLAGAGLFVEAGGKLVLEGSSVAYGHIFVLSGGTVDLGKLQLTLSGPTEFVGGEFDGTGKLVLNNGALVEQNTTINTQLKLGGDVELQQNSILQVAGAVSGSGGFKVDDGTGIVFESKVASSIGITLSGNALGLDLADAHDFKALVSGFGGNNIIELEHFAVSTDKLSWKEDADGQGGMLTIRSGTEVGTLHLHGSYDISDNFAHFSLTDDGSGDTILGYTG